MQTIILAFNCVVVESDITVTQPCSYSVCCCRSDLPGVRFGTVCVCVCMLCKPVCANVSQSGSDTSDQLERVGDGVWEVTRAWRWRWICLSSGDRVLASTPSALPAEGQFRSESSLLFSSFLLLFSVLIRSCVYCQRHWREAISGRGRWWLPRSTEGGHSQCQLG